MMKSTLYKLFIFSLPVLFLGSGCDLDLDSDSDSGDDLVSAAQQEFSAATASGTSSSGVNDIDPSQVVFLDDDVSGWAQTATLNAGVSGGTVSLGYDKARVWPTANTRANDGGPLNANCWVVVNINGTWYAGTFDWLRTGQTSKAASAVTGANGHIQRAPLNAWRPSSGETLGFMVSTPARGAERTINERSNISVVTWP
jgi:hypothetical protein